nr:MAG TPA: hypothetical protein [Caudoviricetes sp.]
MPLTQIGPLLLLLLSIYCCFSPVAFALLV